MPTPEESPGFWAGAGGVIAGVFVGVRKLLQWKRRGAAENQNRANHRLDTDQIVSKWKELYQTLNDRLEKTDKSVAEFVANMEVMKQRQILCEQEDNKKKIRIAALEEENSRQAEEIKSLRRRVTQLENVSLPGGTP